MAEVFVADDNPHVQRMAEDVLGTEGHTVTGVHEGSGLVDRLAEEKPDLVLLDATLPGAKANDVCRSILQHHELERTRIVLLSGPLEPIDEAEATQAGVYKVLQKPLAANDLSALVEGMSSQDEASDEEDADPEHELVESLVHEALVVPDSGPTREDIREQVADAVAAAMPTVIDRIADRIADRLNRYGKAAHH